MAEVILRAIFDFVVWLIRKLGYGGVFFLMLLESANIPVPSEVIMPFSGFLAEQGIFDFWLVVFLGALGNLAGSLISYKLADFIFRKDWWTKIKPLNIFFNESDLRLTEKWFQKFGPFSIFFGRLLPVVRTFISFPAGAGKMNLGLFSLLTFLGSFIWSALLAWVGFALADNWEILSGYFREFDYFILSAFIILLVFWILRHLKGRQPVGPDFRKKE